VISQEVNPLGPQQIESASAPRVGREIVFALERISTFTELGECWRDLETRAEGSFFQSWDWIGTWVTEGRIPPWLLVGRQSNQIVALGLLQAVRLQRHLFVTSNALLLHQLGTKDKDVLTIVYNGLLCDREVCRSAIQGAIQFLFGIGGANITGRGNSQLDELHLHGVPQEYADFTRMKGTRQVLLARRKSWKVDLEKVRSSGRSYLTHLSANTRYQIRRAIRLYEARGEIVAKRADRLDDAMTFYEHLKALSTEYWAQRGKTGSFSYPFFDQFHRRLIRDCVPRKTVELIRLTSGSQLIGYLYNFIHKGWVYAYQSAFVFEDDPKYKPGLVAHNICIERYLRQGARIYDFLPGDGRYKTNLGVPGLDMLNIVIQRRSFTFTLENYLRTAKRALAARGESR